MKRIVGLVVSLNLIATITAFPGMSVRNWHDVKTYDVATLEKTLGSNVGRIVGIRFNFRGQDIHGMKPNWFAGSIWQPKPKGKGFVHLKVMVAKKDLPAFKAITAESQSTQSLTIYGQVLNDSEANFLFVRLIGRNATVDSAGNAVVEW